MEAKVLNVDEVHALISLARLPEDIAEENFRRFFEDVVDFSASADILYYFLARAVDRQLKIGVCADSSLRTMQRLRDEFWIDIDSCGEEFVEIIMRASPTDALGLEERLIAAKELRGGKRI